MSFNIADQIKERINVADLIGEYLKLEKAGVNFKGLCPFHNEKTPSFMVNSERNFWYCFGCQKGGDVFSFLMEMEGIDFRQALERLAEKTGVELPQFDQRAVEKRSSKQKLLEVLEVATKFYQFQLTNHPKKNEILSYLSGRNVSGELIRLFRIGFAPDGWTNLIDFLKSKNFSETDIEKAGLLVAKQTSQKASVYDRFRNRIMFPIQDMSGKTVGFSARVLSGSDETNAKYINTPGTELYDKSVTLYGLNQGKTAVRSNDFVIVVEGNMDVIASHFAGVDNVVAISGTALTSRHANVLKRYTQNLKLCFDMDEAGQKAAQKSIQICLQSALDVEIILLPGSQKDVCDLVEKDKEKWVELSKKGIPVVEYYFKKILEQYNPTDVRTKKIVAKDMLNIIKNIADPIEQSYWLKKLASGIDVDEEVLTKVLEKGIVGKEYEYEQNHVQRNKETKNIKKSKQQILEERILGLFSLYRNELKKHAEDFSYCFAKEHQELWDRMKIGGKIGSDKVDEYAMRVRYIHDERQGLIEQEIDPLKEWEEVTQILKSLARQKEIDILRKDIQLAKEENDEQVADLLMEELAKVLSSKK